MNEARPPALDRDAAAELIEPLTDLVIQAGPPSSPSTVPP